MKPKKILLGITGSIAAYKTPYLIRGLREQGHDVKVVLSKSAKAFITPLTLQAVGASTIHDDLLDPTAEAAMGHIELARWADLLVVAPASANFMAKLAHGMADDLLTTLCLATRAPIIIAPAMNQQMWRNGAT
ncbi:MAG: coaBC, partial [Gammaproteobacteria bacterium]|nr:coaBC [Gammaproteobacteria bacterium]